MIRVFQTVRLKLRNLETPDWSPGKENDHFFRLENLAAENEKIEIVQDENTQMFYVKIKPQLENDPVQGFGDRAVLGLFHIKYCVSHFYLP